jgi:hypothetical protein
MSPQEPGFEAWVQALPADELTQRYRQASSDFSNSFDAESREYFADLRRALVAEIEWRDHRDKQPALEAAWRKAKGMNPYPGVPKGDLQSHDY